MSINKLLFEALNTIEDISPNQLQILEDTEKEEIRQDRIRRRVDDCGKWAYWFDPHTGKKASFVFRCGLFRECDICLAIRADREYKWMHKTSFHKRMLAIRLTRKEANNFVRNIKKQDYVRYPLKGGIDLVIANEETKIENGVEVTVGWVVKQNWEHLTNTPKGRNKSGVIHVPEAKEITEEFSIIATKQFITNAPKDIANAIIDESIKETIYLNPKNPNDVKNALYQRNTTTIHKLKQQGFTVTIYEKKLKLIHSKISWLKKIGNKTSVNTENLTRSDHKNKDKLLHPLLN